MLNGWMRSVVLFACVVCPNWSSAQGTPTNPQSQTTQQYQTQTLTPAQQAAMQRAAQEQTQQRALHSIPTQAVTRKIVQPEGFPLEPAHSKYVNDLLEYWEKNSKRVEKYKCDFRRYDYDTSIVNWRDPNSKRLAANKITMGEIRFAAPDRARYETTRMMQFAKPPQQPGGQADYKEITDESAQERWICDGTSLYDFDFATKRLYETKIPESMQGNVAESPLPFIFGAEKQVVLDRYWVRSVTPKGVENEYWLELFPKRVQDAQNYSKIEVIIAKEDFLPKAMHMYSAQYDPAGGNETSRYFMFENREVNSQLAKLGDFFGAFIRPRVPLGWERVDTQVGQSQRQAATPGSQNSPSQAPAERR